MDVHCLQRTKNEVSKRHLHSWLDEFEYVDVPADHKRKTSITLTMVFRVYRKQRGHYNSVKWILWPRSFMIINLSALL